MGALAEPRRELSPESPLTALKGVGPKRQAQLAAAGLVRVEDLLMRLPLRYEDRRVVHRLDAVEEPGSYTFRGRLEGLSRVRIRRRGLSLVRGRFVDRASSIPALWFNRPYLASQVDPEAEYVVHGEIRARDGGWELLNASVEPVDRAQLGATVVPIYPTSGEVGGGQVRRLVRQALELLEPASELPEPLPDELRSRHGLPAMGVAVDTLHRPAADADVEELHSRSSPAHRRLIYGELLAQQVALATIRTRTTSLDKPHRYRVDAGLRRRLAAIPPFRLTGAQERALEEILHDLGRPAPMSRLLQGDVGCGKTIVAILALAAAVESGLQAALMAPTEILAEQHARTLASRLGDRFQIGLATGSAPGARGIRRGLRDGSLRLVVGTHALIQERIGFADLGLAVIDEQHRFGVAQRRRLQDKGNAIDLLVMTATPIPRSLALTAYGDLDLSIIDEMPPGRGAVRTRVEEDPPPAAVVRWLAGKLEDGHQAFVVLPLIEASEKLDAAALEGRGEEIRRELSRFSPVTVHGRTGAEERRRRLRDFESGRSRLLIATTVIEVGLDVPQAGAMVIESAERFGLAQLHQLRGRVGRGDREAFCLAICRRPSDEARRRLQAFERSTDGFELAEADLSIRGPGDLLGTRQAGLPALRIANLAADREWLEVARRDAGELLERRSEPRVRRYLEHVASVTALESDPLAGA